jgi:hypothetical protein
LSDRSVVVVDVLDTARDEDLAGGQEHCIQIEPLGVEVPRVGVVGEIARGGRPRRRGVEGV